jgi:hypothetical protein
MPFRGEATPCVGWPTTAGGEVPLSDLEGMDRHANLLEVVLATASGGSIPHLLHRGEQQANQNRNDRDDHQQFDESERCSTTK